MTALPVANTNSVTEESGNIDYLTLKSHYTALPR